MKVKELIQVLSKCDQNAKVEIDSYDARSAITKVVETFYDTPDNKYVELFSYLSNSPSDYSKDKKYLSEYQDKIKRISDIIKE